jgi:hypothetical protein
MPEPPFFADFFAILVASLFRRTASSPGIRVHGGSQRARAAPVPAYLGGR